MHVWPHQFRLDEGAVGLQRAPQPRLFHSVEPNTATASLLFALLHAEQTLRASPPVADDSADAGSRHGLQQPGVLQERGPRSERVVLKARACAHTGSGGSHETVCSDYRVCKWASATRAKCVGRLLTVIVERQQLSD